MATTTTRRPARSYEAEKHLAGTRELFLKRIEEAAETFAETKTFVYPDWIYGPPKGTTFKLEIEDSPNFGDVSYVEFDSGRTALVVIDMQTDFVGEHGYVDTMGYDLSLTSSAIKPIKSVLDVVRGTDISVVHTREGHEPDLSDAPFNKVLRSKLIGDGIGIGDVIPGSGRLLTRGEPNWDIVEELYPVEGEIVIDKAGKGAFTTSNIHLILKNKGITHLVITGVTTDVCVHTIMREANDFGYWCTVLKDCTGATDPDIHKAAIKSVKMQGGVFGWVSDSERFIKAVRESVPTARVH